MLRTLIVLIALALTNTAHAQFSAYVTASGLSYPTLTANGPTIANAGNSNFVGGGNAGASLDFPIKENFSIGADVRGLMTTTQNSATGGKAILGGVKFTADVPKTCRCLRPYVIADAGYATASAPDPNSASIHASSATANVPSIHSTYTAGAIFAGIDIPPIFIPILNIRLFEYGHIFGSGSFNTAPGNARLGSNQIGFGIVIRFTYPHFKNAADF